MGTSVVAPTDSDDPDDWARYFDANPEVMHHLLRDVYVATRGPEHRPSLDDLWKMLEEPRFTDLPFVDAALQLLGDRSLRWLSVQVGMSLGTVHNLMNGKRPVVKPQRVPESMREIEKFARAFRVHPSYFSEWRRLWLMSLLDSAFAAKPELSAALFQRYAAVGPGRNGR